jgi:hypothetical protein
MLRYGKVIDTEDVRNTFDTGSVTGQVKIKG